MFLENYFKLMQGLYKSYTYSNTGVYVTGYDGTQISDAGAGGGGTNAHRTIIFANTSGGDTNMYYTGSLYFLSNDTNIYYGNNSTSGGNTWGVILGDGDTAPAFNDYKLSGNIITDFAASTAIISNITDGKLIITATYNITASADITIREIGVTKKAIGDAGRVLLIRDVLATPITINNGQTGVLTYSITVS